MKRLIYSVTAGLLGLAICGPSATAQIGTPTAPPPGGANSPGTAGAAGTASPAGRAGTAGAAGGAFPAGRAGSAGMATRLSPTNRNVDPSLTGRTSPLLNDASVAPRGFDPSTSRTFFGDGTSARQGFGASPGMFDRGATGGSFTGRAPGSALPGRANFSGGSTSATLLPVGPVDGAPNPAVAGAVRGTPLSPFGGNIPLSAEAENNLRAALNALMTPVAPIGPVPVEAGAPPANAALPAEPNNANPVVNPEVAVPMEAAPAPRSTSATNPRINPREAPAVTVPVATATANPTPNLSVQTSTVAPPRPPVNSSATTQIAEIPTGGGAPPAIRNNVSATAQVNPSPQASAPYTVWQGYYWFHNPRTGWQYWNGARWVRFNDLNE